MSVLTNILTKPINYVVGGKDTTPIPFNVKLSIDPDFKRAIYKTVTIATIGIAIGIATGIIISNKRK